MEDKVQSTTTNLANFSTQLPVQPKRCRGMLAMVGVLLLIALTSSGCALGIRGGISTTPAALDELGGYQIYGAVEWGVDDTGGPLMFYEVRGGVDSLGLFYGAKFPFYFEVEDELFYLTPALGFGGGFVGGEGFGGVVVRLGAGLAFRERKDLSFFASLFEWSYDTKTIGVEVSQFVNLEPGRTLLPTSVAFTVGHTF